MCFEPMIIFIWYCEVKIWQCVQTVSIDHILRIRNRRNLSLFILIPPPFKLYYIHFHLGFLSCTIGLWISGLMRLRRRSFLSWSHAVTIRRKVWLIFTFQVCSFFWFLLTLILRRFRKYLHLSALLIMILTDVQFLPISGLYGHNMKEKMPKDVCSWWDGPCLFDVLDGIELPLRDPKGPFR